MYLLISDFYVYFKHWWNMCTVPELRTFCGIAAPDTATVAYNSPMPTGSCDDSGYLAECELPRQHDPACVIVQKKTEDAQPLQSPVMKLLCIAWQAWKISCWLLAAAFR